MVSAAQMKPQMTVTYGTGLRDMGLSEYRVASCVQARATGIHVRLQHVSRLLMILPFRQRVYQAAINPQLISMY